jgi:hypothetical protein
MDYRKLVIDICTLNTRDLGKRFARLNRKYHRWWHRLRKPLPAPEQVPIIINNRNRLTYLKALIERLEHIGFENITILDNDSTYPPLLAYYSSLRHKVVFLKINGGPRALWEQPALKAIIKEYYIYTDPDVVPDEVFSLQSLRQMIQDLGKNLWIDKIGLGLRIDDLPDSFALKNQVIAWETPFHQHSVNERYYKAPVDTTFALYAPYEQGGGECKSWRTAPPLLARHMPWYENTEHPDEEAIYYHQHAVSSASHWTDLIHKTR